MSDDTAQPPSGLSLADHVIIVTGASSGLGMRMAQSLSEAGANLVLTARRADRLDELVRALGTAAMAVPGDLTEESHRGRLIDAAIDRFGRIDGLVNNAGVARVQPALSESTTDFEDILRINLVAPFALARDTAKAMRSQQSGGAIVNISSAVGLIPVSWQPNASYAAAKSGLIGLTKDLASQWGRYGIRVNSIAPGPFITEMSGSSYLDNAAGDRMRNAIALGRIGQPSELDGLLTLLLHPASSYITGQTVAVDGGLSTSL